ncbi:MAG: glycosyltransferase family 4 protein [Gemmatimonadota bacterium]|nr:glycosyltransferase family 4 protein [Gemmatimonadota bacterium]
MPEGKHNVYNILVIGPLRLPPYTGGIRSFINVVSDSAALNMDPAIRIRHLNTDLPDCAWFRRYFRWLLSLDFFTSLFGHLLTFRYHLVHIHTSAGWSFIEKSLMLLLCRAFRVRTALHIHSGRFSQYYESSRLKPVLRYFLRSAGAVLAVNSESREFFEQVCKGLVFQVPNCVHPAFFLFKPRPDSSGDILYFGYLEPEKGVYDLFEAAALLRDRGYSNRVLLAGGETRAGSIARAGERIKQMGLEGVELIGELSPGALADLCRRCGVFVLPSHSEGQPISLLEAMAAGLPVVATDVGGIPEVAADGENGLLVPPGYPGKLADCIIRLLDDPGLRLRMGKLNRKKTLETHHSDRVGDKLVEIYHTALGLPRKNERDIT